jgi:hypothetical protein
MVGGAQTFLAWHNAAGSKEMKLYKTSTHQANL